MPKTVNVSLPTPPTYPSGARYAERAKRQLGARLGDIAGMRAALREADPGEEATTLVLEVLDRFTGLIERLSRPSKEPTRTVVRALQSLEFQVLRVSGFIIGWGNHGAVEGRIESVDKQGYRLQRQTLKQTPSRLLP
jgi:hypothetical protein